MSPSHSRSEATEGGKGRFFLHLEKEEKVEKDRLGWNHRNFFLFCPSPPFLEHSKILLSGTKCKILHEYTGKFQSKSSDVLIIMI